jgi:endonuclease-3
VDTHVARLSQRLALTTEVDPVKIELQLNEMIPAGQRGTFSLRLILHGRRVCLARTPDCERCVLNDLCPSRRLPAVVTPRRRTTRLANGPAAAS